MRVTLISYVLCCCCSQDKSQALVCSVSVSHLSWPNDVMISRFEPRFGRVLFFFFFFFVSFFVVNGGAPVGVYAVCWCWCLFCRFDHGSSFVCLRGDDPGPKIQRWGRCFFANRTPISILILMPMSTIRVRTKDKGGQGRCNVAQEKHSRA